MQRIDDENFINSNYNLDTIVGVRIKNNELYFLAWMENAENYKIQQAMSSDGYLLNKANIMLNGDIYTCITETKDYNSMYILYETDENGQLLNEDDAVFANAKEKFLTLIETHAENGRKSENDHDIFILTRDELSIICDALRDGDYIFIIDDMAE